MGRLLSCIRSLIVTFLAFGSVTQLFVPFSAIDIDTASKKSEVDHQLNQFLGENTARDFDDNSPEREKLQSSRRDALRILEKYAGISASSLSTEALKQLPSKEQWEALYGEDVVVIGEETCVQYRKQVPLERRYIGPAGLFNTGTNMFHQLTKDNLINEARSPLHSGIFQVPWGKHRPVTQRGKNTARKFHIFNYTEVLPVVIIRDPLHFLHSLCRSPYQAKFRHDKHCPNLIPNDDDRRSYKRVPDVFRVTVKYSTNQTVAHDSLIHFWNDWYRDYVKIPDYPALYIRMEDLLMYPDRILSRLAKCIGISVRQPLKLKSDAAKKHGSGTNLIGALSKTASEARRVSNMTEDDLKYVREHVEQELLDKFHYNVPEGI